MKTLVLVSSVMLCVMTMAGCQSGRLPEDIKRVNKVCKNDKDGVPSRAELSLGSITVSTPKFTQLISSPSSADKLDFGDMKKPATLLSMIRESNMGASQVSYDSLSLGLAIGLAGTQLSTSNTTALSTGASANVDAVKLIQQLLASGKLNSSDLPVSGSLKASLSNDASYTSSFKSPEMPEAAVPPSLPDPVRDKLVSLLAPSGNAYTLNAFDTIRLMAQLHNEMVNIEAFNNFDGLFDPTQSYTRSYKKGTNPGVIWAPYKMQFTVTVNPGWYTYNDHYDAVIDIEIPKPEGEKPGREVKFMAVVPQESVQTITEFTAAMNELKMAATVGGAFQSVAAKAAIEKISAMAKRMEGPVENVLHLVSYPDDQTVRIQIRPTRVPSDNGFVLKPTNMLLTAYVLVKQNQLADSDKTAPVTKSEAEKKGTTPGTSAYTALPKMIEEVNKSIGSSRTALDTIKIESAARARAPSETESMKSSLLPNLKSLDSALSEIETKSGSLNLEQTTIDALESARQSVQSIAPDSTDSTIGSALKGAESVMTKVKDEAARKAPEAREAEAVNEGRVVLNGLYFPHEITVKYCGSFVHTPYTEKCHKWNDERYCVTRADGCHDENYRTLRTLLPKYQPFQRNPFGFVDEPTGFYEDIKDGNNKTQRICYISYSVSNPPTDPDELPPPVNYLTSYDYATDAKNNSPRYDNGADRNANPTLPVRNLGKDSPYFGGILRLTREVSNDEIEREKEAREAAKKAPDKATDTPERIMLTIRRENARGEEEVQVRTVVLPPKAGKVGSKTATVDIDSNGLVGKNIPLSQITAPVAAIAGKGNVELEIEEKATASPGH